MAYDDILNSLNLSDLRISRQPRQRTPIAGGPQKMDICPPDASTMHADKMQQAELEAVRSLPTPHRTSNRKNCESLADDTSRRRDQLARKLYVLPYFISGYLQLFLNVVVVGFCVYLLWCFYSTIRDDIDTKVQLFSEELMQSMTKCSKDYRESRCEPELRVPAMAALCKTWEQCMQQDPTTVATRAKLKFTVETIGDGLNAFFEKITWKTLACMCFLFFGFLVSYNLAFYLAARQSTRRNTHWDAAAMGYYQPVPVLADTNYNYPPNRPLW